MKKVLSTIVLAVMAILMLGTISKATTKEDLKEYMLTEKGIAGTDYIIRDEDKVKVERYFNSHEVSDAQAEQIKNLIADAIKLMSNNNITTPNALQTSEKKQDLFAYAQKAAEILGLTVSYDASNTRLYIYENGTKLGYLNWGTEYGPLVKKSDSAKTTTGKSKSTRSALVQTGSTNYIYAIAAGVVLIAGIALVATRKKSNAAA